MAKLNNQKINLDNINIFSNKEDGFFNYFLNLFQEETIKTIINLEKCIYSKSYFELKSILHKCKPRFLLIGDTKTTEKITNLELQLGGTIKHSIIIKKTKLIISEIKITMQIINEIANEKKEFDKK